MNIASNLRTLRELKGYSQAKLGEEVGVSQQAIQQLESSTRTISTVLLVEISKALGCTPNDILGFKK